MKKLIYFFLIILSLSLVNAAECEWSSSNSCTQSGYQYCWENYCKYGSATAHAKIYWQFEDDNGIVLPNNNAIGNLYVKSGYEGTTSVNGYGIYNAASWDIIGSWISCDANHNCKIPIANYAFTPSKSGGKVKIASQGETFTKCLAIAAIDTNLASNGDWAWAWIGYGWVGSGNCVSIKVVTPCTPSCTCASSTCIGQTCSDGCGGTCAGTKCCDTSWSPDPSTICSGISFTQTSNCGNTRSATGTKSCCNTNADTNCDNKVDRTELGVSINGWIAGTVTRDELGLAISAWVQTG